MQSTIEIILKDEVHRIFDSFSLCFNIRIVFFTTDGRELAVGLRKPSNELCTLMREGLDKEKMCRDFDNAILQKALKKQGMVTEHCHAGMIESIIPIFSRNMHLGYCMLGQYRGENKLQTDIIREWKAKAGSPEKIVLAYLKVPSFSEEQIVNIQNFFQVIVDYIVSRNMIMIKHNIILDKIMHYINENLDRNLTIEDISRHIYKSSSSVSHLFSSIIKKSFKQYVIDLKLKKAEEYLINEPDSTVLEIASRLGYDDPYYFSRLFKKHTGVSPKTFLKKSGLL